MRIRTMIPASLMCVMAAQAVQIAIPRVEQLPNLPTSYQMRDWKGVATGFDRLACDIGATGEYLPVARLTVSAGETNFAMPSYVGPSPDATPEMFNEGIPAMGAVLGASLVGIDKRRGPINWVRACRQYYNPAERLLSNRVRGLSGQTYWYELFPHILFYSIAWLYPDKDSDELVRATATRWQEACFALRSGQGAIDFDHTAFDFKQMKPVKGRWLEPDGAAGIGWVEYMAWMKCGESNFLGAADACMQALHARTNNPYYEVQLPFGAYTCARMNAELGRAYDVDKMINWCFDPTSAVRPDMGLIVGRWGDLEVGGLYGSVNRQPWRPKGGGYAFAMNTFAMAWPLVPLVRYDARYARAVGKWMVNTASAARYFYADATPREWQSCAGWRGDPKAVIAYEGIRHKWWPDEKDRIVVGGDPTREKWPFQTDFGIYGSALAGVFGAIIRTTNVRGILQLDCLATDFYRAKAYPTYLYYNPFTEEQTVSLDAGPVRVDLYDAVQDFVPLMELPFLMADDPEAYALLWQKVGDMFMALWTWFLDNHSDSFAVCRMGDDLGFRSSTMLSPDDIRIHIIPQYRRVVEAVHAKGKPFLYHCCGKTFEVMDDIIADAHIDAKHSNEDAIAPFKEWLDRYNDRIGLFGGVDMDLLCQGDEATIRRRTLETLTLAESYRGFAIGCGNSIADYVPPGNFMTMVETVRTYRGE